MRHPQEKGWATQIKRERKPTKPLLCQGVPAQINNAEKKGDIRGHQEEGTDSPSVWGKL